MLYLFFVICFLFVSFFFSYKMFFLRPNSSNNQIRQTPPQQPTSSNPNNSYNQQHYNEIHQHQQNYNHVTRPFTQDPNFTDTTILEFRCTNCNYTNRFLITRINTSPSLTTSRSSETPRTSHTPTTSPSPHTRQNKSPQSA